MVEKAFSIVTGTATLAIFDLLALQHRMTDACDWWSLVEDELLEINRGNAAFLGLGSDGIYHIEIVEKLIHYDGFLYLSVPSGRVFIGAGEDTTGGDLEPNDSEPVSGAFIHIKPCCYRIEFARQEQNIQLTFSPAATSNNVLKEPIRL